jgi:hypothetical protein
MKQRILTLWGKLPYEQPATKSVYDSGILEDVIQNGQKELNRYVNAMESVATLHSVSSSHLMYPDGHSGLVVQFFVTVLYTGPSPKDLMSAAPRILDPLSDETTVLRVDL